MVLLKVFFSKNLIPINIFAIFLFAYLSFAVPVINYVSPTLGDNATTISNWIFVNATITEAINQTIIGFSGTNYTIYEPSLVLNLPLNENSGVEAYDNSPYGNNGGLKNGSITCANSDCPTWAAGKFGSAIQFDGINDYVGMLDSYSLNQSFSSISISFWFKAPTTLVAQADNAGFISKTNLTAADYGVYVAANTENIRAGFSNNSGAMFTVDTEGFTPALNTWHQIDWVFNSTHNLIYVNGALNNISLIPGAQTIRSSNKILAIGALTTAFFNGTIDGVRIYNRSLSADEVARQYNMSFGRYYANFTNLADGTYNHTVWAQNTTGDWNQSSVRSVTVDTVPPYSLYACQNLAIENGSYVLMQNVSSAETCFVITANNILLDGNGYLLNYSQSSTGYGIYISNKSNITIKNLNILKQGASITDSPAIFADRISNSTIANNTIITSGTGSTGIFLNMSSANTISNNSVVIYPQNASALDLGYGSSANTISENNFTTKSSTSSPPVTVRFSSNSNTFANNRLTDSATWGSSGFYIDSSDYNTISGGSIYSESRYSFYFVNSSSTNNFTDTNFTAARDIRLNDTESHFKYSNDTEGYIWLATNVSAATVLTRTLSNWTDSSLKWNDTNSTGGIIAGYSVSGLLANIEYKVYNTSGSVQTNPYTLTADENGTLPSFTIALNGNTAIKVETTAQLDLYACQALTTPYGYYRLVQNVSSPITCFVIRANGITLDGQGYTVNYSYLSTQGYGVKVEGYSGITIKNLSIVKLSSSTSAHAIYANGMSGSNITNNTIRIYSGTGSIGIFLKSSSINSISSNDVEINPQNASALSLAFSSNSNNVSQNTFSSTSVSNSPTVSAVYSSNSNNFINNTIIDSVSWEASGFYMDSVNFNSISGGSIASESRLSYYFINTSSTNNFTNTNFTASRNIYFYDNLSWFKYSNNTAGLWLTTNVSAATIIGRTLVNWTNASMQWNDTSMVAGITAHYTTAGLQANTLYRIYNTSSGIRTNAYDLATDSSGSLNFAIALNGNTEIEVKVKTLETLLNTPSDLSHTNNQAITFNCSASSIYELTNITLYGNWSGSWAANETVNISGTSNSSAFARTPPDGSYKWNCLSYDASGNSSLASSNYTFSLDTIPPQITYGWGTPNNESRNNSYARISITSVELLSSAMLKANGVNQTMNGSGTEWYTILYTEGNSTFRVFAADLAGNQNVTEWRWAYIPPLADTIGNLSNVKVAMVYESIADRMQHDIGRNISTLIDFLNATKTDLIFRGWFQQRTVDNCTQSPPAQVELCKNASYSYEYLNNATAAIKEALPNIIIIGAIPSQEIQNNTYNPETHQFVVYPETWNMSFDPTKFGIDRSKEQFQCSYAKGRTWLNESFNCTNYNPATMTYFFPDITDSNFQSLLLSWAKKQIDSGADGIWFDMLTSHATEILKLVNYDINHPAVIAAYSAESRMIEEVHNYKQGAYASTWSTTATLYPFPAFPADFYTIAPTKAEVLAQAFNQTALNMTLELINEKRGDVPVIAFTDWSDTPDTQLGVLSQNMSVENQSAYIRAADAFYMNNSVVFAYPLHGGYLGTGAPVKAFGTWPYYDAFAPEFNTYRTIKQLALAKRGLCATCRIIFTIRNRSGGIIQNTTIRIYNDTNEILPESGLNDTNPNIEQDISDENKYYVLYTLNTGHRLLLRNIALSTNITIDPQFVDVYSGMLPSSTTASSYAIALNASNISFDSAEITLPVSGTPNKILHCLSWDFASAACSSWISSDLSAYNYTLSGGNLTFNITSFDAYMAGTYTAPSTTSSSPSGGSSGGGKSNAMKQNKTNTTQNNATIPQITENRTTIPEPEIKQDESNTDDEIRVKEKNAPYSAYAIAATALLAAVGCAIGLKRWLANRARSASISQDSNKKALIETESKSIESVKNMVLYKESPMPANKAEPIISEEPETSTIEVISDKKEKIISAEDRLHEIMKHTRKSRKQLKKEVRSWKWGLSRRLRKKYF